MLALDLTFLAVCVSNRGMLKRINWNTVLLLLGGLAGLGPDVGAVSAFLVSSGIPHAVGIVHLLAYVATALGALALALPKLRSFLAMLGLATPPGAQAPWDPKKDVVFPFPPPPAQAPKTVPVVTQPKQ